MEHHKPLFILRFEYDGFISYHPVESWGDYGVVCPSLATTNGSARYLAKYISQNPYLKTDDESWPLTDEDAMFECLMKAHKAVQKKEKMDETESSKEA